MKKDELEILQFKGHQPPRERQAKVAEKKQDGERKGPARKDLVQAKHGRQ